MKTFARADRVAALMQRVLADILRKGVKDPRLDMATITGVSLSRDLKNARVYFAISGNQERVDAALQGFNSALGYIRRAVAEEMALRYMPSIRFVYDTSFDYGDRIEKVLKTLDHGRPDHNVPETE